jgi:hypothetical protein
MKEKAVAVADVQEQVKDVEAKRLTTPLRQCYIGT